jgi:hypothetical protein
LAVFGLTAAPDGVLFRDSVIKMYVPAQPLPYHALSQVRCRHVCGRWD